MRVGDYVIAARGETLPQVHGWYGGLDSAVRRARQIAGGKREWAVFTPACRSNTAGTMLVRGKGRKVRWFPAGREAAGLLSKRVRPGDIARLTQRMRDSMVRRHQIDRAAARRKGVAT